LQLQRRDILYLPCFAYQVNLYVADIFKSNPDYVKVATNACSLLSFFNASTYWLGQFRYKQVLAYNKYPALIHPGEAR
ncbi:7176_t:CDS:1, partial [Dentiscutata heterogama]